MIYTLTEISLKSKPVLFTTQALNRAVKRQEMRVPVEKTELRARTFGG